MKCKPTKRRKRKPAVDRLRRGIVAAPRRKGQSFFLLFFFVLDYLSRASSFPPDWLGLLAVAKANIQATGTDRSRLSSRRSCCSSSIRRRRLRTRFFTREKKRKKDMWKKSSTTKKAAHSNEIDVAAIQNIFQQLADEDDTEVISMDGIAKLCEQLKIDAASDVRSLVLVWKLGAAEKPGQIQRTEFVEGMKKLGVSDIAGLARLLPSMDPGFMERAEFRGARLLSFSRCSSLRLRAFHFSSDVIQARPFLLHCSKCLTVQLLHQISTASFSSFPERVPTRPLVSERPRKKALLASIFAEYSSSLSADIKIARANGSVSRMVD